MKAETQLILNAIKGVKRQSIKQIVCEYITMFAAASHGKSMSRVRFVSPYIYHSIKDKMTGPEVDVDYVTQQLEVSKSNELYLVLHDGFNVEPSIIEDLLRYGTTFVGNIAYAE